MLALRIDAHQLEMSQELIRMARLKRRQEQRGFRHGRRKYYGRCGSHRQRRGQNQHFPVHAALWSNDVSCTPGYSHEGSASEVSTVSTFDSTTTATLSAESEVTTTSFLAADCEAFRPKTDLRKYEILEELGRGSTATVYRCRRGEEVFAAKVIDLSATRLHHHSDCITTRMRQEVSIHLSLKHPRVVCLHEVLEVASTNEPPRLHLVMELVEGGDLFSNIVSQGFLREAVARPVFRQIIEGLMFIHSKDIVHRDLKPENILVAKRSSSGEPMEVKLTDFGHAKLGQSGLVVGWTCVGSCPYMAPEVWNSCRSRRGYDQMADLWSLGVVLYLMLMAKLLFDNPSEATCDRIASMCFREDLSGSARAAIKALIRKSPKARLPLERCLAHAWVLGDENELTMSAGTNAEQVEAQADGDMNLSSNIDPEEVPSVAAVTSRMRLSSEHATIRKALCMNCVLRVSAQHGAGLFLEAKSGGMLVVGVDEHPGQSTIQVGDLITSINGVSMSACTAYSAEATFSASFADGATLTVERPSSVFSD